MPLFLTETEKKEFTELRRRFPAAQTLYWTLLNRTAKRASVPGLGGFSHDAYWWQAAADYLTDAAMAHAFQSTPPLSAWLRDATLSLVRRPLQDWIGPAFRDHSAAESSGNLETAHFSWAVAVTLDLAGEIFSESERSEISDCLHARGVVLCRRWLDRNNHLANWRCVLNAGACVAAAVLGDREQLKHSEEQFKLCQNIFQPDGSHSESLQYGNYAALAQMLSHEALIRHSPALADSLPLEPYVLMPRWQAASLFYKKALAGRGSQPLARSANFNDSAAIFRPSADLLLHISSRGKTRHPREAGLARWLFDSLYTEDAGIPGNMASFGFENDFGFLTPPLLAQAAAPLSPEKAGVEKVSAFSCGDMFAKSEGTILAVRGAGDALCGPGHLHGDLNSFILVHNRERLLVDPGHSCYRNLIRELDKSTRTHNTCTFSSEGGELQQSSTARRRFNAADLAPEPPVARGGSRLLQSQVDDVIVMGSEAAALYGAPLQEFSRFWILCGSRALFVVDRIRSSSPVKTTWHWLLNNRDDSLDLKIVHPDRLIARRGDAGMKLFHLGGGKLHGPTHGYVHDAYYPGPNHLCEGRPGSGLLMDWTESTAGTDRTVAHAICLDSYGPVAGWHLKSEEGWTAVLEGPQRSELWKLKTGGEESFALLEEGLSGRRYALRQNSNKTWSLEKS